MKKIIITRSQLNEVMDSQKTNVTFTGSNAQEMGNNAQEKYNDAVRSGLKPNTIKMDGKSINNNTSDKDETVINVDTTKPNLRDAVTSAVNNAVNNGVDINKLNVQGNSEDILNGNLGEGKSYSKKQVELARLNEMKKNGHILTKKELREAFGEEYNLIEKLKNMNMFEVFEAYRKTFGDEALQDLSNHWNTMQHIINTVYSSDESKKQEFIQRINGERDDDPNAVEFELDLNEENEYDNYHEYYIGVDGYNINTGKIENFNSFDDDIFDNVEDCLQTIKYMLTYPQQSSEYDIRYANDCVLLLSVCEEHYKINNIIYMSSLDKQYFKEIQRKLPNKKIKLV